MKPMGNAAAQPSSLSHVQRLESDAIHILREAVAEPTLLTRAVVMLWVGCGWRAERRDYAIEALAKLRSPISLRSATGFGRPI